MKDVDLNDTADSGRESDEALALALQRGDEQAFTELVRRYQGRAYAVAYRVTGNREDALDVTQEAFVKVHRKIDSWKPSGAFSSWLLRLTTNQAIDQTRRRKRHLHERLDEGFRRESGMALEEPTAVDSSTGARGQEIGEHITRAMEVLSPSQRTVFVLRHYEGLALKEIAPVLGCSVGSVKVHLFRALKKLQKELGELREQI